MNCDSDENPLTSSSVNFTETYKINPVVSFLLGLRSMEAYCRRLPLSDGLLACVDRIVIERNLNIMSVKNSAHLIPQSGPLLITANHPTGILDGVVLLCALLSRRADVFIIANDSLAKLPVFGSHVIPIRKSSSGDQNGLRTLIQVRRAWKRNACVVVFPAGTVSHWQWDKFRVCDAPWLASLENFARLSEVVEIRAQLNLQNPLWFHIFAAILKPARSILLLHVFLKSKNSSLPVPVSFNFESKGFQTADLS